MDFVNYVESCFAGRYGFKVDHKDSTGIQLACRDNRDGETAGPIDIEKAERLKIEIVEHMKSWGRKVLVTTSTNYEWAIIYIAEIKE